MERLRFFQIPKTGGTTFTTILFRQYFWEKIFVFSGNPAEDKRKFDALSASAKKSIALFTGHMPLVTGIQEADNAKTITFLRNPINRVKSFCQHASEGKSKYLLNDFPPESFSLDKFLESGNIELSNFQTRMLLGNNNNASLYSIENMPASQARDAALDILLNKISYFGLQEYFDESLIVFSTAFNWNMPFYSPKNVGDAQKPLKFEEHHLKRIAELNEIDIEVYRIAEKQFISRLEDAAFLDKAKLKRLQLINKTFGASLIPAWERISWMINRCSKPLLHSP